MVVRDLPSSGDHIKTTGHIGGTMTAKIQEATLAEKQAHTELMVAHTELMQAQARKTRAEAEHQEKYNKMM